MSVILDLISSAIIAGLLIVMMITFQYQLRDTAQRALYTATMVDHMDMAATKINQVIALAGVGMPADSAVISTNASRLTFRTYWSYQTNQLTDDVHSIMLKIADSGTQFGKALMITEDGVVLDDAGYIFFIDAISFVYYDVRDEATTLAKDVRAMDVLLTFRRPSPMGAGRDVVSKIQIKCFIMNSYLKGG